MHSHGKPCHGSQVAHLPSLASSIMWTVFGPATHIGDAEESELQHARDGPFYVVPVGTIVPQPVTRIFSHTWEGGAGQHQGTVLSKHPLQSAVGWMGREERGRTRERERDRETERGERERERARERDGERERGH